MTYVVFHTFYRMCTEIVQCPVSPKTCNTMQEVHTMEGGEQVFVCYFRFWTIYKVVVILYFSFSSKYFSLLLVSWNIDFWSLKNGKLQTSFESARPKTKRAASCTKQMATGGDVRNQCVRTFTSVTVQTIPISSGDATLENKCWDRKREKYSRRAKFHEDCVNIRQWNRFELHSKNCQSTE